MIVGESKQEFQKRWAAWVNRRFGEFMECGEFIRFFYECQNYIWDKDFAEFMRGGRFE